LGYFATVIDESSGCFNTTGKVERVYWREEQLWVRIRNREGLCLLVPWQQTDLPRLTTVSFPPTPRLSLQSLVELVRHLKGRGPRTRRSSKKTSLD
jgi:hypothetical protein